MFEKLSKFERNIFRWKSILQAAYLKTVTELTLLTSNCSVNKQPGCYPVLGTVYMNAVYMYVKRKFEQLCQAKLISTEVAGVPFHIHFHIFHRAVNRRCLTLLLVVFVFNLSKTLFEQNLPIKCMYAFDSCNN